MFLVCCQQSYLPLESLRARQHIDQCLPLFDKPHSAWPSSPTLNSSPRNQAGKVLTPHSPHLSPLASLEGWELAKARISRALCYNPVFRGPCVFGVGKGFDWWVFHLPGSSTDLSGLGNLINLAPATLDVCADEVVAGTWLRLLVAEELPGERLFFFVFSGEKFKRRMLIARLLSWLDMWRSACMQGCWDKPSSSLTNPWPWSLKANLNFCFKLSPATIW